MAMEALSSTELFNFIMYDPTPSSSSAAAPTPFNNNNNDSSETSPREIGMPPPPPESARKKRRRRPKICKNKEEAETQRMTHIAVERNRRKQMNEHLAVLRSLMPESYVQRGDQASIVGGAIEFVKELEHIVQSLEAKKFEENENENKNEKEKEKEEKVVLGCPFAQFFTYPQFSCSHGNKFTSQSKAAIADIEVTLIETHANIRVLSRRRVRQLSKIVASFQSVLLTILHLNVTTLDSLVLYSISAKVEEGCQLNSADDIAGAVHHMLRIIEEEAILGCQS